MTSACKFCEDTGSLQKSLYGQLDCAHCNVASERVQLAEFITTQRDEPHVLAWRVHVRASRLALGDESVRGSVRKEVADFAVSPDPTLLRKKFFDLPLGTRFRHIGGKSDWIVLERHGCGKVAGYQPHDGWVAGQSIFSFADSEEECRTLEVDVVLPAGSVNR